LIGFPNAGKSSFLNISTRARPKIANYPFTTINPNLGVVQIDDKEIVLADIPGLIEGAHKGIGLGDKFLKHIERCKSLLHIIDINEDDLIGQYKVIREELKQYSEKLIKKKEIVVFNKIDLLEEKEKNEKLKEFKKFFKKKFYEISILKKENINTILRIL
jgi:GTP-binding protein